MQQGASDPKSEKFEILADVYELDYCTELYGNSTGKELRVEICARNFSVQSNPAKKNHGSFSWGSSKKHDSNIDPLEVDFNVKVKKREDIFVYLLLDNDRVGFIRYSADNKALKDDKPTWLCVNDMVNS